MGLLTKRDFENYKNMFSLMEKLAEKPIEIMHFSTSFNESIETIGNEIK